MNINDPDPEIENSIYDDLEAHILGQLQEHDLITSPAFIVIKADNEFKDKTSAINEMWQTDFTYLKIRGLSTATTQKQAKFSKTTLLFG